MSEWISELFKASPDVILQLVGLLLIVLCVVGSIQGKIQIDKPWRIVGIALGVVLLGIGVALHYSHLQSTPAPAEAAAAPAATTPAAAPAPAPVTPAGTGTPTPVAAVRTSVAPLLPRGLHPQPRRAHQVHILAVAQGDRCFGFAVLLWPGGQSAQRRRRTAGRSRVLPQIRPRHRPLPGRHGRRLQADELVAPACYRDAKSGHASAPACTAFAPLTPPTPGSQFRLHVNNAHG